MTEHGLFIKGWTFEFDRATSRLGQTDFGKKRITISRHFTGAASEEEFNQTLIHEIAHALLPVSAKHGPLWKMKARSLGYTGNRLAHNPYQEQLRASDRAAFVTHKIADLEGVDMAAAEHLSKVLITANSMTTSNSAPNVGDVLTLPNGMKLEVKDVNPRMTKAVEVATGAEWNLSTKDAYRFLK